MATRWVKLERVAGLKWLGGTEESWGKIKAPRKRSDPPFARNKIINGGYPGVKALPLACSKQRAEARGHSASNPGPLWGVKT